MSGEQQFKRNTAFKHRVGDLLAGRPVMDGEKFTHLELGDKKIVRVNVIGNIVDKYESEGEKKYIFLKLDDGSGQISLKAFGDDVEKFSGFNQGNTVVVIGVLRYFNNETYIAPEIIKEQDSKYLLVRKMEIEKERAKTAPLVTEKKEVFAIKDKILEMIKSSEDDGGIDTDKIKTDLRETSPEVITREIQKLLEEGIVFEPRPGRLRWLG